MTKIKLENVSYVYGAGTPYGTTALDNINLEIEESMITGIIGHTGCGKSTLVQLLNGLLKPTSGTVYLDGTDIWQDKKNMQDVRFKVGLVFQYPEYQLFEETVYRDIAFGPRNMGLDDAEIDRRVRNALQFVGLDESVLEKSPFELSGGQKRRVAIAGIFAMEPEVLVLDEPAAGLDPMGREEILGGIRSYQRIRKSTVIIVSHSMEDMARYSDRLIMIGHGSVLKSGTCKEVFSDSEALAAAGLELPQITSFMMALKQRGIDVDTSIYTVKDAKEELLSLIARERSDRNA